MTFSAIRCSDTTGGQASHLSHSVTFPALSVVSMLRSVLPQVYLQPG